MRLDYSLRLNSLVASARRAWSPARLFAQGQSGTFFSARQGLFIDLAGTQPAQTPGQAIALMRDLSGNGNHASQPDASQRPTLGRHPARGVVNIYPANTTDLQTPSWGSFRLSATAAVTSATGEPAVDLHATQSNTNGAAILGSSTASLSAGIYTFSAYVKGSGWFALRPSLNSDFADAVTAWFNLGNGSLGSAAAAIGTNVVTAPSSSIVPIGDGYRVALTFTVTQAMPISVRLYLVDGNGDLGVSSGVAARLEAPQLEAGTAATSYQRRISEYDLTEAGQGSVWYLSADGVDDWMQLAQPFTGGGPFAMAAAREWQTGWPGPVTLGSVNGASAMSLAQGIILTADGSANQAAFNATAGWPPLASGQNRVDIVRVESPSAAQAWRNGTAYPESPVIAGNITQFSGIDSLFRAGSGYGKGRFYGGVIVDGNLSDDDRIRLNRYLSKLGGIPA